MTLEIHPPDGFKARQSSPDADAVTTYEVTTSADPDTGCTIDIVPSTNSGRLDQPRINATAATSGYRDAVKASLAEHFDVRTIQPFSMQGADGAVATGDVKAGEGALRAAIFVVETPLGKVQVACIAATDEFAAWRPLFEGVARGVVLPH